MTREALRSQSAGVKNAPKCVAQAEDLQTGYGKKKVSEGIRFSLRTPVSSRTYPFSLEVNILYPASTEKRFFVVSLYMQSMMISRTKPTIPEITRLSRRVIPPR